MIIMHRLLCITFVFFLFSLRSANSQNEKFSKRVIIKGMNSPWEIIYGPDDSLWVTECMDYHVKKVDPRSGKSRLILDLSGRKNFTADAGRWPQGGLMGMALHPSMIASKTSSGEVKPWVYLAYVYDRPADQKCATQGGLEEPCYFKSRIERYEYVNGRLINPVVILENIPGSNDHNSGRLVIGSVTSSETQNASAQENYLYYSIGDMGAGQFNNSARKNNAQDPDKLEGKIICLNTEPDQDTGQAKWIPDRNPFNLDKETSPQDYVYSFGHRNAQGLVIGKAGGKNILYSSEHGPYSDDEINIIWQGGNYGWNKVAGFIDNNYNGLNLGGEGPVDESNYQLKTIEPIATLFTVSRDSIAHLSNDNYTWPSVAPSSIDFYGSDAIPGWRNSLLITTLKSGKVFRLKLDQNGLKVHMKNGQPDVSLYFSGEGRFRDLAIAPDGKKIYVACDKGGRALGIRGKVNKEGSLPRNSGAILEFSYQGK